MRTIGHVTGFMADDPSWIIRELAVATGRWYSGREILISTSARSNRISYEESNVSVGLAKADIQRMKGHAPP